MSKHTISMKDEEWDALVADSIGATVLLGRPVSVSEYIRIIAEDARKPLRDEQGTRTDAQPTGQSGRDVPLLRKAAARMAKHENGDADLGECAKCSNRATREHYPYCSKKCAT